MSKQDQRRDERKSDPSHDADDIQANAEVVESGKKLQEDIDDLVDEIDQVLEENAAEFVKNYVQKGGQ